MYTNTNTEHVNTLSVYMHRTLMTQLTDLTCKVFQFSLLALSTAPFECIDILCKHTLQPLQSHNPHVIRYIANSSKPPESRSLSCRPWVHSCRWAPLQSGCPQVHSQPWSCSTCRHRDWRRQRYTRLIIYRCLGLVDVQTRAPGPAITSNTIAMSRPTHYKTPCILPRTPHVSVLSCQEHLYKTWLYSVCPLLWKQSGELSSNSWRPFSH